jgi:hypothetical protein
LYTTGVSGDGSTFVGTVSLEFNLGLEEAMSTLNMKSALVLLLLLVCVGGALPLWAQSTSTGTIAGTITDPSGAVVPGATVVVTDISTNVGRNTTTNKDGRYVFVDVNPGTYNISISKSGFATTKADKQEVNVGAAVTLNLSLQVGGANVVVEVQATGVELQTMNATVGNTVTAIAIDNLPSIGRDVNTFIEMQPGVSAGGDVAGAVNDQSYFSLDGGNNTNDMDGSGGVYTNTQQGLVIGDPTGGMSVQSFTYGAPSGVMPTPADSVEEFKVNTAGQTADFNSSAGAEIKVVTKRGRTTKIIGGPRRMAFALLACLTADTSGFLPIITAGLAAPSGGRSLTKRFSGARPSSFSTMKVSGIQTPRPSSETSPRRPCGWGC